jgi:hypothetical protein
LAIVTNRGVNKRIKVLRHVVITILAPQPALGSNLIKLFLAVFAGVRHVVGTEFAFIITVAGPNIWRVPIIDFHLAVLAGVG